MLKEVFCYLLPPSPPHAEGYANIRERCFLFLLFFLNRPEQRSLRSLKAFKACCDAGLQDEHCTDAIYT